jgi:hypothetical protein
VFLSAAELRHAHDGQRTRDAEGRADANSPSHRGSQLHYSCVDATVRVTVDVLPAMAFGVEEGSEIRKHTVSDVPAVSWRPVSDSCDNDPSVPICVPPV